eukprot:COSAG06_NODE_4387_length_4310_cov_19.067205_2_plen_90_part_00
MVVVETNEGFLKTKEAARVYQARPRGTSSLIWPSSSCAVHHSACLALESSCSSRLTYYLMRYLSVPLYVSARACVSTGLRREEVVPARD